jgi:radical SAM superfamily enzyme YgiQ (UPF0313 family)
MRVQLFVPPGGYFAERWTQGSSMPPLGLLYIGAVLESDGHEVRIVPADLLGLGWNQVAGEIREFEPELIGVTSTTENRFQSFKLVRVAKKTRPEALTIMGGPHASMAAEDCLEHIPELDIACRGEGEQTVRDLCSVLDEKKDLNELSSVAGIAYRANGKLVSNPRREPIDDLDSIPRPAYHLVPFDKYNFRFEVPGKGMLPAVNMMSSRGCPFNCNFCATPINWGRAVRMRSPENIVEEIEFLKDTYGAKVIFFFDDTLNTSPKRVHEICGLIIKRKLDIYFKCDIRLDVIDKPLIEKMKQAGLFHLSFGLEAGSERVRNEVVNKKVDIDDFHNLVKWCQELDIIPNAFFIFSHPTETWEEAQETIDIIEKYKDSIESSVAILHVYPGTPLERTAKDMGILPEDFTWTKRYRSKIITLPAAQGDVPLFVDKLKWSQICELIFRWSLSGGKASIMSKIPQVLRSIRSFGDIRRYAIMAWVYIRLKLVNIVRG